MPDIEDLLPPEDLDFVREKGWPCSVYQVGAETHVVFTDFQIPDAYEPHVVDLLVRLPPGYPNAAPDMYWTRQTVRLKPSGGIPEGAGHHEVPGTGANVEVYENKPWQRWSRHFQNGWRPGTDGLRSYIAAVINDLQKRR